MRIVSGKYGGRRLIVPSGQDIRPTSDKIRGAMFNALRSRGAVEDAYVLDGFCGTGALGLEALSQGAAHCTFIDNARTSLDLARENARALNVLEQAEFQQKYLAKIGQNTDQEHLFTLVFLDPPYRKNLISPALEALDQGCWLAKGALCVVETEKEYEDGFPEAYALLDERVYGETKVTTLCYVRTPE